MSYLPSKRDLAEIRSMAIAEMVDMPNTSRHRDSTPMDADALQTLAYLRSVLKFLGSEGALDQRWLKKIGARPDPKP